MCKYDFTDINLKFSENFKLFCMRFKKKVSEHFLCRDLFPLTSIGFIKTNHLNKKNEIGKGIPDGTYSLTDKYIRYCIHRRHKFFDSKIWPFIISIATAIITSFITAYITSNITVQSMLR